jgi:alcohol dehydrogenase (cytochrome c)
MATIDAHLIAIDSKSGHPVWNTEIAKPEAGYAATLATLVIKDKVIIGTRAASSAFEVPSRLTTPRPARKHGDFTPFQHAVSRATHPGQVIPGNTAAVRGPDWNGDDRAGDNL